MKTILCCLMILSLGTLSAQSLNWQWAQSAGGNGYDLSNSVATDIHGNVYVAGGFRGTNIQFGNIILTNSDSGTADIFIAKYDILGNVIWAKSFGGIEEDIANSITIDLNNNIYIAGSYGSSNVIFNGITLTNANTNSTNVFIVKSDSDGNVIWGKSSSGVNNNTITSICNDVNGNIYVAGYFESPTLIFDIDTVTNAGSADIFIAKYNSSGNLVWVKTAGGTNYEQANGISTDAQGNIYMTGFLQSPSITFGGYTLNNTSGSDDLFVVKYDPSGNVIWAKNEMTSSSGISFGRGICSSPIGDVYITGAYSRPMVIFGNDTLINLGSHNFFIAKYDSSGNIEWAEGAGGTGYDFGTGVSVDANGVYVVGSFSSPAMSMDSIILTNAGIYNVFLAGYDFSGNIKWAKGAGGTGFDNANGVCVDSRGNLNVVGTFRSTSIVFGAEILNNVGTQNIFTASLHSNSTGVSNINTYDILSAYPNPSNGIFFFNGIKEGSTIEIYDILGQNIFLTSASSDNYPVNLAGKGKGIYFYKVIYKNNSVLQGKMLLK